MGTVGIFAGRGDVVLGYLVVLVLGLLAGWYLRGKCEQVRQWWQRRNPR